MSLTDSLRFWEGHRVLYNAALAAVVAVWCIATWPHFRPALTWRALGQLAGLALAANICYSAAYAADIIIRCSEADAARERSRTVLWWLGTVLAVVVANYWIADEIYPFVR